MRDMPVVSVVIPSFRGGAFLRDAIASVQAQTFEDWELIVILDGCEDDLSEIERDDDRIRTFHQENRGECVSRNVGIGHAEATSSRCSTTTIECCPIGCASKSMRCAISASVSVTANIASSTSEDRSSAKGSQGSRSTSTSCEPTDSS